MLRAVHATEDTGGATWPMCRLGVVWCCRSRAANMEESKCSIQNVYHHNLSVKTGKMIRKLTVQHLYIYSVLTIIIIMFNVSSKSSKIKTIQAKSN